MPRKTGKLRECDSKATPDNGKFSQGPAVAEAGRHRTKDPFWKQHLRNSNAAGKPVIPAHATSGPPTRAAEALGAGGAESSRAACSETPPTELSSERRARACRGGTRRTGARLGAPPASAAPALGRRKDAPGGGRGRTSLGRGSLLVASAQPRKAGAGVTPSRTRADPECRARSRRLFPRLQDPTSLPPTQRPRQR